MISVRLNGETRRLPPAQTLAELLTMLGYQGKRVAVERNGDIVPRSRHGEVKVCDGDALEIVVAVGGG